VSYLILFAAFLLFIVLVGGDVWERVWRVQRRRVMPRVDKYRPRTLWRRLRKRPALEVDMPTVRDFILTLQLSLSLAETLAGALTQAARQFAERGQFGVRLNTRVRSQLQVEPEAVIRALAIDFQSKHLTDLAERLEMAHEGGLSYSQAVDTTLDDVEEEIRIEVEKEIERAPVMLTIPMIIGVFFAALALLGFPLLVVMFNNVTGSIGGGGGAISGMTGPQ
jgi:hypothetical protein